MAIAVVISACGAGEADTSQDPGRQTGENATLVVGADAFCNDGERATDAIPLVSLTERGWTGIKVAAAAAQDWPLGELLQPDPSMANLGTRPSYELEVSKIGGASLLGEPPARIRITDTQLADILAAESADVGLFISDAGNVTLAAIEAADGSISFAGVCDDSLEGQLSSFRSANATHDNASGIEVLVNLFENVDGARDAMHTFIAVREPTPWSARDPATRVIDPEETPADVFAQLTLVTFTVTPNADWAKIDGTICTRIKSVGWNECIRTSALASADDVEMTGTALAGENLELWLLDNRGNVEEPLAFLGVITEAAAIGSDAGQTVITLSPGISTIQDVIAQQGSLVAVVSG